MPKQGGNTTFSGRLSSHSSCVQKISLGCFSLSDLGIRNVWVSLVMEVSSHIQRSPLFTDLCRFLQTCRHVPDVVKLGHSPSYSCCRIRLLMLSAQRAGSTVNASCSTMRFPCLIWLVS